MADLNLELFQMNVKITFLIGELKEEISMKQLLDLIRRKYAQSVPFKTFNISFQATA